MRIRRSLRCGCGPEQWQDRPLRIVASENDEGEALLVDCEDATGERPIGCPWAALRDPWVGAVIRAHRHWKTGALSIDTQPASVVFGIETFDAALNAVQVHDIREDREEQQRAADERALEQAASPRRGLPHRTPHRR